MTPQELIATYEAILETSGHMLEAARQDDWEHLIALERKCSALVQNLIADPVQCELDGTTRKRKAEIIRRVLADDAQIRSITQPWMEELNALLTSASRGQALKRAYGYAPPKE